MTYRSGIFRSIYQLHQLQSVVIILLVTLSIVFVVSSPVEAQLRAPGATSSSVTLTWTAPGDDSTTGTAAQYDIRYSTSLIGDDNWNNATQATEEPSPQIVGTTEIFEVTGLEPSTTYYFGIKAADEIPNWSALSNIAIINTEAETETPSAVADLNISDYTSTAATLSWTAPGDDGTNGTASQYELRYATFTITAVNFASATLVADLPAPQVAGSAETYTVTDLNPSTTYYFALKTADEVPNWSEISNVASGTTGQEEVPPADIDDLIALVSTTTTIALSWTAPGDDGTSGTATEYELRYATFPISSLNWGTATLVSGVPDPEEAGGSETFTVEGLTESTTYYFAIKTGDEVPNWSGISNVLSAATTGDISPPTAITDLGPSGG
ncbi:MAG: fibronectin type III domain-containing protein [candidate division Zixibacteria bacterium]|nr:fibronectin type III domain-containing protein [candidate division Zixibacteria bacterium]